MVGRVQFSECGYFRLDSGHECLWECLWSPLGYQECFLWFCDCGMGILFNVFMLDSRLILLFQYSGIAVILALYFGCCQEISPYI